MADLIITSKRVVTPEKIRPASIHIRDGLIAAITERGAVSSDAKVIDVSDSVVMPGLVDTHVHVNEPGRTDWEGFSSATRAAAAGGVTTLVDMPLNSIPPTTALSGFREKLAAARGQCWVDVAFWGGVVPGNLRELRPLMETGVRGFKCFLVHSGVNEFPNVSESDLRNAMPILAELNTVLLVHAEVPGSIERAAKEIANSDPKLYHTFLKSRPHAAENEAIAMMIRLSRETGARVHIVHLSSSEALPMLREARADGVPITVETCPHYLTFSAEDVADGATEFKCCPPVRERENREKLWEALREGVIDMVVSDHSPCPPHLKLCESGNFMKAWGGIASLQFGLPVMWTEMKERDLELRHLAEWMSHKPAQLAGLHHRKGALKVGYDADLVIWNPEATFRVEPSIIQHKHKLTPYNGRTLNGIVEAVYVRGQKVYDDGKFSAEPLGQLLTQ
ncbi:allantoinase AllB [Candidatus Acetothermia bacterium]|nr:allantoinase AllB [Candidatus Acetothermia bacterium]